jgi:hypothetical protein
MRRVFTVEQRDRVRSRALEVGAADPRVVAGAEVGGMAPGCLQVDLSFTPASEFGARGPRFRLLFGEAVERRHLPQPSAHELFGLGVHHAVRARYCIERGRPWQAEYWISGARDQALSLACRRLGLEATFGRGFDGLPAQVLEPFVGALVQSLEREELLRALEAA